MFDLFVSNVRFSFHSFVNEVFSVTALYNTKR